MDVIIDSGVYMMEIGSLRKAVAWVTKQLEQHQSSDKEELIKKLTDEASRECDLSPFETADLKREIMGNTQ